MKPKTLGLIAFVSIFLSTLCWGLNFIFSLFDGSISLGKVGYVITLVANVCSVIVLLVAAYAWVKNQKTVWKVIYWIIAVLAILSIFGVAIKGFSL